MATMSEIVVRFLEFVFIHVCNCWHGTDPPITDTAPSSLAATNAYSSAANPANHARPGENMTKDALDKLIVHLEERIRHMQSTSVAGDDSSQVWEEYTSDIPAFLQRLNERAEATAAQIAKDTVLPLLVEVFEGISSLNWVAFGCSMLAWGIDKVDKLHENFNDCLELLKDVRFLVKAARYLCDHLDLDQTLHKTTSEDSMKSHLPRIGELAFTASAICVSCSGDNFASLVTRFLGAPTLEQSISKLNDRIKVLQGQNDAIGQMILMYQTNENMGVLKRLLTEYHTLQGKEKLLESVESLVKTEVMSIIINLKEINLKESLRCFPEIIDISELNHLKESLQCIPERIPELSHLNNAIGQQILMYQNKGKENLLENLKDIHLKDSMQGIVEPILENLKDIDLKDSLQGIVEPICENLKDIDLKDSLQGIAEPILKNLKDVDLKDSLQGIAEPILEHLKDIDLKDSLQGIAEPILENLKDIDLKDSLQGIAEPIRESLQQGLRMFSQLI